MSSCTDPTCPCQDGDACHYVSVGGTRAWSRPSGTLEALVLEPTLEEFLGSAEVTRTLSRATAARLKAFGAKLLSEALIGALEDGDLDTRDDGSLRLAAACILAAEHLSEAVRIWAKRDGAVNA